MRMPPKFVSAPASSSGVAPARKAGKARS
jgi:hypothetical protein